MKKIVIVARYNEDVSWVKKLNDDIDVIVYNKGNDWPYEFPRFDLPNKGREAQTFLTSIDCLYDILNTYDQIVFLQGNPFDHFSNTVDFINTYNDDKLFSLTNRINPIDFMDTGYVFEKHSCLVESFFNKHKQFDTEYKNDDGDIIENNNLASDFLKMRFVCMICGIPLKGRKIAWTSGAQFIVPTRYILNKSKNWWHNLHLLFVIMSEAIPPGELTAECIFERLWLLFYSHEEHEHNVLLPCSDI